MGWADWPLIPAIQLDPILIHTEQVRLCHETIKPHLFGLLLDVCGEEVSTLKQKFPKG